MNILSKLLQYRGIKDTSELDAEERTQFEQWRTILDKDEVSVGDIKEFCTIALQKIEAQFEDVTVDKETLKRLVDQHTIYRKLKDLIVAPQSERESLIEYLTNLMH